MDCEECQPATASDSEPVRGSQTYEQIRGAVRPSGPAAGFFTLPSELRIRIYEECVALILALKPPMFNGHGTRPYNGCIPTTTFDRGFLVDTKPSGADMHRRVQHRCQCFKRPQLERLSNHGSWEPYLQMLKSCKLISRAFRAEFLPVYASAAPFAFHQRHNISIRDHCLEDETRRTLSSLDKDAPLFLRAIGPEISRHIRVLRYYCKPWRGPPRFETLEAMYNTDQGHTKHHKEFDEIDGDGLATALPVLQDVRSDLVFDLVVASTIRGTRLKTLTFRQVVDGSRVSWVYQGCSPVMLQFRWYGAAWREQPIAEIRSMSHERPELDGRQILEDYHRAKTINRAVLCSNRGAGHHWRDVLNEDNDGVDEAP